MITTVVKTIKIPQVRLLASMMAQAFFVTDRNVQKAGRERQVQVMRGAEDDNWPSTLIYARHWLEITVTLIKKG